MRKPSLVKIKKNITGKIEYELIKEKGTKIRILLQKES